MTICVIGCSHHTADVALREQIAVREEALVETLEAIKQRSSASEVMLLSTCNRVEVYAASAQPARLEAAVKSFWCETRALDKTQLDTVCFVHTGDAAIRHIFRVAASLDAMVVGEAQVLGQVKRAFAVAHESGYVGTTLCRLMHKAFSVAKRVRAETDIARYPASVSSIAVDIGADMFGDLSQVGVLVVGAGEVAELALAHLNTKQAPRIRVANRNPDRAQTLAERYGGQVVPLTDLENQLVWADIAICSTGSDQPIIDKPMLAAVMRQRKQRLLLVVDIAVPRDVCVKAHKLPNVYVFDMDGLQRMRAQNLKARQGAAESGEKIIEIEGQTFAEALRRLDAVPLIKQLRQHYEAIAQQEVEKLARRSGGVPREDFDALATAIVNKLLHEPTMALKRHACNSNGVSMPEAARCLFGLNGIDAGLIEPDSAGSDPETKNGVLDATLARPKRSA